MEWWENNIQQLEWWVQPAERHGCHEDLWEQLFYPANPVLLCYDWNFVTALCPHYAIMLWEQTSWHFISHFSDVDIKLCHVTFPHWWLKAHSEAFWSASVGSRMWTERFQANLHLWIGLTLPALVPGGTLTPLCCHVWFTHNVCSHC